MRSTFRIPAPRDLFDALKAKKKLREAEEEMGVTLTPESEQPAGGAHDEPTER